MKIVIFSCIALTSSCIFSSSSFLVPLSSNSFGSNPLTHTRSLSADNLATQMGVHEVMTQQLSRNNRPVSPYMIRRVCEIIHELYEVDPEVAAVKLQGKNLGFKNLEILRRNLLAQTQNSKKLKNYLESTPHISIQELNVLLLFAEGKKRYGQFKKFDQNIFLETDESCARMIIALIRKKESLKSNKEENDPIGRSNYDIFMEDVGIL
jgi:hypothetical protein